MIAGPGATLQTRAIPERADIKGRVRTENFLGTFAEDGAELVRLNQKGYGIFTVVNETAGRKDRDVTAVRCVCVDFDEILEGEAYAVRQAKLALFNSTAPISLIVETSPGKFHVYCRAINFPLDRFQPFQKELAAVVGSCPSVTNLSHVMRVPGFMHQKGEPFLSRVVYTRTGLNMVERLVGSVAVAKTGGRNDTLFKVACRFKEWELLGAIDWQMPARRYPRPRPSPAFPKGRSPTPLKARPAP